MQTQLLNYRIIITPDLQTETGKSWYIAICPTIEVADDGDTLY